MAKKQREKIIPDLTELANQAILNGLDTTFMDAEDDSFYLKQASSVIEWATNTNYMPDDSYFPYPRQIQFLVNLFEHYCPCCSNLDYVFNKDAIWGKKFDDIKKNITFLEYGTCPRCHKNKNDFRRDNGFKDYNELIGVAGQRCLAPDTLIRTLSGIKKIIDVNVGEIVIGPYGKPTKVLNKEFQEHCGYFDIVILGPNNKIETFRCSDSHEWKLSNGKILPASELERGMAVCSDFGFNEILEVTPYKIKSNFVDIEVENTYFLSKSGIHLHNSGKTAISAMIATYIIHRWVMMKNPTKAYGLKSLDPIQMDFIAMTADQIKETGWGQFIATMEMSRWFREYYKHLDRLREEDGILRYKKRDTFIEFKEKNLLIKFSVPDGGTLRGRTRLYASCDEFGYFRSEGKAINGDAVYDALTRSLQTIRSAADELVAAGNIDPLMPLMVNVSSPSHGTDPIMKILNQAKDGKKPRAYYFHYATWDINPRITEKGLESIKLSDPVSYWRDFAAEPPMNDNPFFSSPEIIDACIDKDLRPQIDYVVEPFHQVVNDINISYMRPILKSTTLSKNHAYVITCDAGEVECSYAMVISHYDRETNKFYLDSAIEIEPVTMPNGKVCAVHFPSAMDFILGNKQRNIYGLKDACSIAYVGFDRWQSTPQIQQIRDTGTDSNKVTLTYDNFCVFKANVADGKWRIPQPEADEKTTRITTSKMPFLRLILQTKSVGLVGIKVKKPEGGMDDIFRCWALADHYYSKRLEDYLKFADMNVMYHVNSSSPQQYQRNEYLRRISENSGASSVFGTGRRNIYNGLSGSLGPITNSARVFSSK